MALGWCLLRIITLYGLLRASPHHHHHRRTLSWLQMNYDYAQNKFCPPSALPGFMNHQSERDGAASLAG
jgi:hypothetical protein